MAEIAVNFEERKGLGEYPVASVFSKSISANDTLVVEKRDYPDLIMYVKVDGACDVVLDAVSGVRRKPDGSYAKISVSETIMSFSAAGEQVIRLSNVLTKKWGLHYPFLHLKFTADTTIDLVALPAATTLQEAKIVEDGVGLATEATLSDVKAQTDKLQFDASNFLRTALASDEVGLATESTLSGIKTQTDKLQFDANNFLRAAIASDEVGLATDATLTSELTRVTKPKIYDDTLATPDWVDLTRSILQEAKIVGDEVGLATEATLSNILSQLDITLSTLRDAITAAAPNNKTLADLYEELESIRAQLDATLSSRASESTLAAIRDKSQWAKLDNLDTLLSSRAPKDEGATIIIASAADVSGGVIAALNNFKRWTLYLHTDAAIDITVELSPDGGSSWFLIPESPISFSAAADDVIEFGYDATHIRLTGSNTTPVTAIIRGVF